MRNALACWLFLLPAVAMAQAPARLGYQARLLKADGAPQTGVLAVTFSIYATGSGGAPLWTETQTVGLGPTGLYTVVLGDQVALSSSAFDGTERFLEVSIAGTPLLPRQRISSVAYALSALRAQDADTLDGKDSSDFALAAPLATPGTLNAAPNPVDWSKLKNVPAGFADGADDGLSAVAHDATLVGNGAGAPLGVDLNQIQRRVTGACGTGFFIAAVNSDGTVTCAPDGNSGGTVTSVVGTAPLSSTGGTAPAISVSPCNSPGQILKWNGSVWACAADVDTNSGGTVTSVTAAGPLVSSGGATPALSMPQAGASSSGWLSSADWNAFDGKAGVPSGAVMFFNLGACPSGWTQLAAATGRYLVGGGAVGLQVGTALGSGENRAAGLHNHAITDPGHNHSQNAHGHGISDPGHSHSVPLAITSKWGEDPGSGMAASGGGVTSGGAGTGISVNGATASNNPSATGISVNNSGSVAGTNAPYLQLLACQKN